MLTEEARSAVQTLQINKEVLVDAPIDVVWETVLQSNGELATMNLKLEPWPGGRWYRDLGNNTGHLWGHVQVIKPPKLLEICGPMFMSYPVASHIQYRLAAEGQGTRLTLVHQAMGMIAEEHSKGVQRGWEDILNSLKSSAEAKKVRA
jgi:uncharacterized protein YndB with AHSA1/START domain